MAPQNYGSLQVRGTAQTLPQSHDNHSLPALDKWFAAVEWGNTQMSITGNLVGYLSGW